MLPGAAAPLPRSLPLVQCSPPCRAGRAFSSSVACVAPYSRNTMPLPSLPPSLPPSSPLPVAPPPQLSVEPKVPFLRSLAHFAFAATSLARPRGFLARHGGSRQRCWPPSILQKLLPQQGARSGSQAARAGIREPERAPGERGRPGREGERALRSRTTRPCPPIIVRVTDGGERSIGDRKPVGRRPPVRGSRAMSDRQGG